jgi:hypothetical protein
MTYYVLFFIHLESRGVDIAGITIYPNEPWMKQMARNVTMGCGILRDCRYLLLDHDTKFTLSFRAIIASGQVEPLALPARSPNLNAYAERWVRSVKEECLSKVILFGERSLRRALSEYVDHYHPRPRSRAVPPMPRAIGRAPALLSSRGRMKRRSDGVLTKRGKWPNLGTRLGNSPPICRATGIGFSFQSTCFKRARFVTVHPLWTRSAESFSSWPVLPR